MPGSYGRQDMAALRASRSHSVYILYYLAAHPPETRILMRKYKLPAQRPMGPGILLILAISIVLALVPVSAFAQTDVELISRGRSGDTGGAASGDTVVVNRSSDPAVDGRFVAYSSQAANLLAGTGDHNAGADVFVHDKLANQTILVSRAANAPTRTGNDASSVKAISADGRWILYLSAATNLIAGSVDLPGTLDVFLFDRETGTTMLVSRAAGSSVASANQASDAVTLSADGRYVVFETRADNVLAGYTNSAHVRVPYLFHRESGSVVAVVRSDVDANHAPSADSYSAAISADGRYVLFGSYAWNLIDGVIDANQTSDAFVYDRDLGSLRLLSRSTVSPTHTANGGTAYLRMSADGRWVLFSSNATDLVPGPLTDANGTDDVFAFDLQTATVTLVSRAAGSSTSTAAGSSTAIAISDDGRYAAFSSTATNVVAGVSDTNGASDVFVRDLIGNQVVLLTRSALEPNSTGNRGSQGTAASADGTRLLIESLATDLIAGIADDNNEVDVFLADIETTSIALLSKVPGILASANAGTNGKTLDAAGTRAVLTSTATNLVPGVNDRNDQRDLFVRDEDASLTLVSRAAASVAVSGDALSEPMAMTPSGRFVIYRSIASNMIPAVTDLNSNEDVFLYDRHTHAQVLVSHAWSDPARTASGRAYPVAITPDGRHVLYGSYATDVVAGQVDTNGITDVFVFDRDTGVSSLISHSTAGTAIAGNQFSAPTAISADGRMVLFRSNANNLVSGDNNGVEDVFLHDRMTGITTLVSRSAANLGSSANATSYSSDLSNDGRYVLYHSNATDLVPGLVDTNGSFDVFLYDHVVGSSRVVTHNATNPAFTALGGGSPHSLSGDGSRVLFLSQASDLVAGVEDFNFTQDVFVFDVATGENRLVSRSASHPAAAVDGDSWPIGFSPDGRWVLYESDATDLVAGQQDSNNTSDAFVHDLDSDTTTLISHTPASPVTTGNGYSIPTAISADGRRVLFRGSATDLVPGFAYRVLGAESFAFEFGSGVRLLSYSRASAGAVANGNTAAIGLSHDGRHALFYSAAADLDLAVADSNRSFDAFMVDLDGAERMLGDGFED